jgi:hypothetical protein
MKYLIMVYTNPTMRELWASLSDEQRAAGWAVHNQLRADMAASGELVHSEALVDPALAKLITVRGGGEVVATDGPFAESKEQLAGFYLVDCENIERAIDWAARLPEAGFGMVEVRAALSMSGQEM